MPHQPPLSARGSALHAHRHLYNNNLTALPEELFQNLTALEQL